MKCIVCVQGIAALFNKNLGGRWMSTIKVLCIHGVGHHPNGGAWQDDWEAALAQSSNRLGRQNELEVAYFLYDGIFANFDITPTGTLTAIAKLTASGIASGVGDMFAGPQNQPAAPRAARSVSDRVRWTAGMVVQWAEDQAMRAQLRLALEEHIKVLEPDIIFAHSLGSLIAYDTFRHKMELVKDRVFVSFGSQIGNPFVRSQFAGRIEPLSASYWYHLYNIHDDVLTTRIPIADKGFEQVMTPFDIDGMADHDATQYLAHENVTRSIWSDMVVGKRMRKKARAVRQEVRRGGNHDKRALIIGIDAYDNPSMRLEGCVNDAFLMSEVLQENGFESDNIRLLLDHRATAAEIWQRLEWLLEGTMDGQQRILCFSGHGAQLPDYGADETVDRVDECLVPFDFDWTHERAITDDRFQALYSQLPYGARFTAILDCCHSGGMTRSGGGRPRGLSPPDDIRHRTLKWDPEQAVWVSRKPPTANRDLTTRKAKEISYIGKSGQRRLMRATDLLTLKDEEFETRRETFGHMGPFLPIILQACQEEQLAYEYRHGVTSYGAFSYSLAQILRDRDNLPANLIDLEQRAIHRVKQIADNQVPQIVAPGPHYDKPLFSITDS